MTCTRNCTHDGGTGLAEQSADRPRSPPPPRGRPPYLLLLHYTLLRHHLH